MLVFTDLDGTLLDHETYDWTPARPALEAMRTRGIPWVIATSKTRAEVEVWRRELEHEHPFIVENGGAIFIPRGYFSPCVNGERLAGQYDLIEFGVPYQRLVWALAAASESSGCEVRGFSQMSVAEVAEACSLSPEWAERAKLREYDEAFEIHTPNRTQDLLEAIRLQGLNCARGGRFWHILGENGKGRAVHALERLYEHKYGPQDTVGLGDGLNDADFLSAVKHPILVRSAFTGELHALVPNAIATSQAGPAGWNEAVLQLMENPATPNLRYP